MSADPRFRAGFAAAEQAHGRYLRALRTLAEGSAAHRQVLAGADRVDAELERAARLLAAGERATRYPPGGTPFREGPRRRLTRRQRLTPYDRHLHNLNRSVLRLYRAADAAVGVAVAVALAAGGPVESTVDDELAALTAALDELR